MDGTEWNRVVTLSYTAQTKYESLTHGLHLFERSQSLAREIASLLISSFTLDGTFECVIITCDRMEGLLCPSNSVQSRFQFPIGNERLTGWPEPPKVVGVLPLLLGVTVVRY